MLYYYKKEEGAYNIFRLLSILYKQFMKYSKGSKRIGLPELYRFGVELEAFNVNTGRPTEDKPSLYMSKESKEFLKQHRWKNANIFQEDLVMHGGAECVSPILYDREEDWQNLAEVCMHMKKFPGKYGDTVVTDDKCGCHVHIDARTLTGKDIKETEAITGNFLKIWAEGEELIYKMCNEEGSEIRAGALENTQKGLTRLVMKLQHIKAMASPIGKKVKKDIDRGRLKVSHKKQSFLRRAITTGKLDTRRYYGLNLTNIGNPKKNTVEFRMGNGTLNPETIKQNVFLYASIIEAARTAALEPEKNQEQLTEFFKKDVTEEQKADAFLALIFESEEDRKIYKDRWESVKDAHVFERNQEQFAQTFKRDEFKQIAERTPITLVKEAFDKIKTAVQQREVKERETNDGLEL